MDPQTLNPALVAVWWHYYAVLLIFLCSLSSFVTARGPPPETQNAKFQNVAVGRLQSSQVEAREAQRIYAGGRGGHACVLSVWGYCRKHVETTPLFDG